MTDIARSGPARTAPSRPLVSIVATLAGGAFVLVGILGFVPGITTDYDLLSFAGHHSAAKLLGVFEVSVLHNLVHVLFGLAGLILARSAGAARNYLVGGGFIYLILWLYGMAISHDSTANFVPVNAADNWLHCGLGAGMILLGLITAGRATYSSR
jgi:hypothetical protein